VRKLLIAAALAAMTACTVNPLKTAESIEQQADAYYGVFVIAQEGAVQIAQDPATPQSVKVALRDADRIAKPLADDLHAKIVAFGKIKAAYVAALAAGDADSGALAAAEKDLSAFLGSVIQSFNKYRDLVNANRSPAAPAVPSSHVMRLDQPLAA
jgi:hypothetical protein